MQITSNTTPFLAERFVSTDKTGQKHCVVVVRATFDVNDQGRCVPASEQVPFVYCDQHHGDPGTTSVRFETDFAPVKPRVDVLVHASAVSPKGEPVTRLQVGFAGAGIHKLAVVSGDRVWTLGVTGIVASPPSPFTSIPLSWDRAFGGSDQSHEDETKRGSDLRNLAGVGFHLNDRDDSILNTMLPNVERHDDLMGAWTDKPQPVGFAPSAGAGSPVSSSPGHTTATGSRHAGPFCRRTSTFVISRRRRSISSWIVWKLAPASPVPI